MVDMWFREDRNCWYDSEDIAFDDLYPDKVYTIPRAVSVDPIHVVLWYNRKEDEYEVRQFLSKTDAEALLKQDKRNG